jgi:protein SCO1/2
MHARRLLLGVSLLAAVAAAVTAAWHFAGPAHHHEHGHAELTALEQTYLPIAGSVPLSAAAFTRADGSAFPAQGLEGRWTLLFFGFTSCPDVCPMTLQALTRVARDPASGVAQGSTQILFVSTDPGHDTPERMRAYLANFDAHIVGLTGAPEALRRLGEAAGAGFSAGEGGMDHSTSIFVLDPHARVAGVLLRASEPALVMADLAKLQRVDVSASARVR